MNQQRRLSYVLGINLLMIVGLVIVGLLSHSISVLAAGGDFVADSAALGLGLIAVHLRDKRGNIMAPTYVALVNVCLLLAVTTYVLIEASLRLIHGSPEVHGLPVMIIALVSAGAMVIGALILGRGAGSEDLHMRSVLLDTISDGLSAAAVAMAGGIIFFANGWYWIDAATAIAVALIVGWGAIKLLKDVFASLRKKQALETGRN